MRSHPFLIVGTGRCGTNSLAKILNALPGVSCYHEYHSLPWYSEHPNLGKLIRYSHEPGCKGESSYQIIPWIRVIMSAVPDLKVIHVMRDKESTVKSFCDNIKCGLRPETRKFLASMCKPEEQWFRCLPILDGADPAQAWGFYYDLAMALIERAGPDLVIDVRTLSVDSVLHEVCDLLGVPEDDRKFPDHRHGS